MDGTRAIQGGMTAGGGGPPMDGLDIPTAAAGGRKGGGGGTLATWLNMLTNHRHHRRESFGFTDSIITGIGRRERSSYQGAKESNDIAM